VIAPSKYLAQNKKSIPARKGRDTFFININNNPVNNIPANNIAKSYSLAILGIKKRLLFATFFSI